MEEMSDINSSSFAPADFPDANEVSLYNYSMAFETNYSMAVNNAVIKQTSEIKDKQENISVSLTTIWKKRFREFLITKNSKLLDFLSMKLKTHPVLGATEHFITKFGKQNINFNQQSIRDIVLDISGTNILDELNGICISNEYLPLQKYMDQTKFLMDEYKLVAEKILDKETLLKMKLDKLNSIQGSLKNVMSLSNNEHYNELMETTEKYIGKIYEENNLEEDYNDIMNNYSKLLYLRDVLKTIRTIDLSEKEPLCSVCFNESIGYAFVPCGHTFCITCIKRQTISCGICRTNIRDRVKLYFS